MARITASSALRRTGIVGLLMLCITLPAQAQWKWKDAQGKIQYSDLPPPQGTPEKDIMQRPPGAQQRITLRPFGASAPENPVASGPTTPTASAPPMTRAQELEQQAKQREEIKRAAEVKKENCRDYENNLDTLQSGRRIRKENDKGEQVYLDADQIAAEIQRTRALIAKQCR